MIPAELKKSNSQNAEIEAIEGGWRLMLHADAAGGYRLAQLDDYGTLSRNSMPHRLPLQMSLKARVSQTGSPGTWGFGLWNDPFGFSLGFGAGARRLPTLPNAAWFFFASPENHLALNEQTPASGAMAAVFRSPYIPAPLLVFSLPLLPLLVWPTASRWLRRKASHFIHQEGIGLDFDPTQWHVYGIRWGANGVGFALDGKEILASAISPLAPLGLIIWIDNQYAAWPPNGRMRYGTLPISEDCWVEIKDLQLE